MKAVGYTEQLPIDNDQALIDLELPRPVQTEGGHTIGKIVLEGF